MTERIRVVDSHTEGEPTRVVIEGWPMPNGETMAEQWQRVRPTTCTRNYRDDGKDDHGMSEFTLYLGLVDTKCRLKLNKMIDGGDGFTIFFSDGSSYRMNLLH